MKGLPNITDAEWQVMKVLWATSSATANDVIEELSPDTSWKPKTVKTLLNRLVNKKALGYTIDEKDKRTYHYYALVEEEECVRAESQSFLDRIYGGSVNILLTRFLEEQELSANEIDELKNILDKKKTDRG